MTEQTENKPYRRYIAAAVVLVVIGIAYASLVLCDTTPVPNVGPVAVTATTICLTGSPGGKTACPWAPAGAQVGPPPAGTVCLAAAGNTCNSPGASCNFWTGTCADTYHLQTTACKCRCD